jgi:hypothetical protein
MRIRFLFAGLLCLASMVSFAQTTNQNSGWLFLMNSARINKNLGIHFDLQLRSQDHWDGLRNVLIRPGLTYFIDNRNDVTLGYLFTQTQINLDGTADFRLTEHRIWEQYIHKHKINTVNVSHRLRLEQRFTEKQTGDHVFAQRLRYFVRFLLPLKQEIKDFEHGLFAAIQNEIFLNVQHKDEINGHLFDQNRAYAALGYRLSRHFDVEAGYMNQFSKGLQNNTRNNIMQLALYTRF